MRNRDANFHPLWLIFNLKYFRFKQKWMNRKNRCALKRISWFFGIVRDSFIVSKRRNICCRIKNKLQNFLSYFAVLVNDKMRVHFFSDTPRWFYCTYHDIIKWYYFAPQFLYQKKFAVKKKKLKVLFNFLEFFHQQHDLYFNFQFIWCLYKMPPAPLIYQETPFYWPFLVVFFFNLAKLSFIFFLLLPTHRSLNICCQFLISSSRFVGHWKCVFEINLNSCFFFYALFCCFV